MSSLLKHVIFCFRNATTECAEYKQMTSHRNGSICICGRQNLW